MFCSNPWPSSSLLAVVNGAADADLARLGILALWQANLQYTVCQVGFNAVTVNVARQRQRPGEGAVGSLDAPVLPLAILLLLFLATAYSQHVILQRNLH